MKLYTARYNAQAAILDAKVVPVRISVSHPRFRLKYKLEEKLPDLYPARAWLSLPFEQYRRLYVSNLETVGYEKIRAQLEEIAARHPDAEGLALLCFEDLTPEKVKPGDFCHRRIWAQWMSERSGLVIPDLERLAETLPAPARAPLTLL